MDILAGILAYVAGIGALFGALAFSFFIFFSAPSQPIQRQSQPQNASAMLVRPSAPSKSAAVEAHAKQIAGHSEKAAEKRPTASPSAAWPTASARDLHRKGVASAAQLRRLVQEERAHRWAYQQDSTFESRFLGYAD